MRSTGAVLEAISFALAEIGNLRTALHEEDFGDAALAIQNIEESLRALRVMVSAEQKRRRR